MRKWWRTPPELPDIDPTENLWHELKDYLRGVIKPRNKQELVDGILTFWAMVKKVIPKVIEYNGNATGY